MSETKEPRVISRDEMIKLRRERVADTFKLDPEVNIKLRGKDFTLEFNNAAVKRIYKETGHNILSMGFGPGAIDDPVILSETFLAGLLKHHPNMTMEQVDDLLGARHMPLIIDHIRRGLAYYMPDMSDVQEAPEDTAVEGSLVETDPTQQ